MSGGWLGLASGVLVIVAALVKWWFSPERWAKLDRKERDRAHAANATKDGRALGAWFRKRRRR